MIGAAAISGTVQPTHLLHADKNITDLHVKMQGRIKERQTWAEKTALGFKLPKKLKLVAA